MIVPWNDPEALPLGEFAAIICEPYPANMGLVPPSEGFLAKLRRLADETGALLVFDEVISGFRVARGGAQQREDVLPDLTILGKIIGGGVPAAAYAGRRDLMERVAPAGDVYQAGTLSGNPLATAAGLATLRLLDARAYARLEELTARSPRGSSARRRRPACRHAWPGRPACSRSSSRTGPSATTRTPRPATPNATEPSAERCSIAASTCPRLSSRPGSRRSPTATLTSTARSRPPREALALL